MFLENRIENSARTGRGTGKKTGTGESADGHEGPKESGTASKHRVMGTREGRREEGRGEKGNWSMNETDHLEKGEAMSEHKTPGKRETPFMTYEVENGLIKNEVGKPLKTVYDYLRGKLREDHYALWERLDYFDPDAVTERSNPPWPFEDRIACFAIPGASEGYYVHVEGPGKEGRRRNLLLGKCWSWDDALELSNVLTRLIY